MNDPLAVLARQTALDWLDTARRGVTFEEHHGGPDNRPRAIWIAGVINSLEGEDREILLDWVSGYPVQKETGP